jgi:hypothetical protein
MKKIYLVKSLAVLSAGFLMLMASCKKDSKSSQVTPAIATPTTLGVYGVDSSIYKELLMAISKIGTQTVNYDLIFDTGSGGMVIDGNGIVPASMMTSSGFNFTGDSTVVNGITITKQTSMIEYGADSASLTKVYGNLAYAPVTLGDVNGNTVITRLPFFIYYKAVDNNGTKFSPHDFDIFGVSNEYDITFANNVYITSPFYYFKPGNGLTNGFKMGKLNSASFSYNGTYDPIISLGLTSSDLSSSSGFTMSQLYFYAGDGYAPIIPATVTYNGKSVSTQILFDTGTDPFNYIEDPTLKGGVITLPSNSPLKVTTTAGFSYSFTTSDTDNLTFVENPNTAGGGVTVLSLENFLNIQYMLDFTNNKLGLKVN